MALEEMTFGFLCLHHSAHLPLALALLTTVVLRDTKGTILWTSDLFNGRRLQACMIIHSKYIQINNFKSLSDYFSAGS